MKHSKWFFFPVFLLCFAFLSASESTFSLREQAVLDRLKEMEPRVDPVNGFPMGTHRGAKGYHSNFEQGTWIHSTRGAMDRAACLLASPKEEDRKKGGDLLERVLLLQDQNPESDTFGVWPWYAEEPLEKMAFVDYNWADFLGATLAVILHDYSDRLSGELREKTKKSLEYACRAIIKRNVGPAYTNIAMMGATVTAAAGEILDNKDFLDYGRARILRNLEHYRQVGGFNEYNSPTYTITVVDELERMLYLVKDAECRRAVEILLFEAWKTVAEHYHPPTGEWAGPHSRSYADRLSDQTKRKILSRAGLLTEKDLAGSGILVPALPVPESLRPYYFKDAPGKAVERQDVFEKGRPGFGVTGTTWMDGTLAVGTASYHSFWEQARGLIAYWTIPESSPAVFRLRFLHDGNDFAGAWGRHFQSGRRLVSTVGLLTNLGSMHPSFDRPKDGVFQAKSFRIEFRLEAEGATVKILDENRFELAAGPVRVVVHTVPESVFDGKTIRWMAEETNGTATLTGVCYQGEEKAFKIAGVENTRIAFGLEFLEGDEQPADAAIRFVESDFETKNDGAFYGVVWPGLNDEKPLLAPARPTKR